MARLSLDSYEEPSGEHPDAAPVIEDASHLAGVPDEFQRLWTPTPRVNTKKERRRPTANTGPSASLRRCRTRSH